jgi:diguanylate cyclase (GGDEF)-like protein
MRLMISFLCFCVLYLGGAAAVPAAEAATLSGVWRYHAFETPSDKAEEEVQLNEAVSHSYEWNTCTILQAPPPEEGKDCVYLTTQVSSDEGPGTLFFFTTGQAIRVYLNKERLYSFGELRPMYGENGSRWHIVELPSFSGKAQLTIECYSPLPERRGQLLLFQVNTLPEIVQQIFLLDSLPLVSFSLTLYILAMMLFFFFHDAAHRRLYLSILAFLVIFLFWLLGASMVKFFFTNATVFWWFELSILAYLLPIAANCIIYEVLEPERRRKMRWIILAFSVLTAGALLGELFSLHTMNRAMDIFYVMLFVLEPAALFLTFRSAVSGNIYSRALLAPILTFTICGCLDGISRQHPLLPWSTYFTPFGIVGFVIFVIVLLRSHVQMENQLDVRRAMLSTQIAEMTREAAYDPLTRSLNRTTFSDRVAQACRVAEEQGTAFSLLMCDIDHFKQFNDRYGHEVGDKVLVAFARVLRQEISGAQTLVRWGGEEFVILAPGLSLTEAGALAETLLEAVRETSVEGKHLTMSVGIAGWKGRGDTQEKLFERMDGALYYAKQHGRNQAASEDQLNG